MTKTADHPLLSDFDVAELIKWRRNLHRQPELSGQEERTAQTVRAFLANTAPDRIITGIGGYGVAAIYDSGTPGLRVLLRCELDGLPIEDLADVPHRSTSPGKGHQCGHDGHMAILAGMARILGQQRPATGAVVLMFQPAEEDGSGALAVVNDAAFDALKSDYAFAIHNMPGIPFGQVLIKDGPVCCASRGMTLRLTGRTAHASQPEMGLSPMAAISRLMPGLTALSSPSGTPTGDFGFAVVTVTHAQMGAPAFGIAPGEARLFVTLRTLTNAAMSSLVERAEALAQEVAQGEGLDLEIGYSDVFVTTENDPDATAVVRKAMEEVDVPCNVGLLPMRASEDFGHFGRHAKAAIMLLGAGEDRPALHNPDYDFPDQLIPIGARIYAAILKQLAEQS
ncbi:amidohydrolase [Paracoccus aerius]|uniref:Amidohydrolase n=1 Tax=Paracoccus aerius TaxID=1915382 RepID=A0ABS1SCB4_9RHOB|nr:amidohydrolase [Paracoccus aerius]MBL3675744.1 amidohydrolase [Paracoccus aerius]GHG36627.1 amidohydrolase [Paracoccus aerius]